MSDRWLNQSKIIQMANPIPVAPPVTMAVFPFKEISFFIMLSFRENVKKQQKIFKIKKKIFITKIIIQITKMSI